MVCLKTGRAEAGSFARVVSWVDAFSSNNSSVLYPSIVLYDDILLVLYSSLTVAALLAAPVDPLGVFTLLSLRPTMYHHKQASQAPTFLSLHDLAVSQGASQFWLLTRWHTLTESLAASSQEASQTSSPAAIDFQKVGFWLATIDQVQDPGWVRGVGIGLMVCLLGEHSRAPKYPHGTPAVSFAVMFETGREWDLKQATPRIVSALSQGQSVGVHCLNSFHRGPVGLAAICRRLFNYDVRKMLHFLSTRRSIWHEYAGMGPMSGSLGGAARWAARLSQWIPDPPFRPTRPVPGVPASSQVATSAASSSSSGAIATATPAMTAVQAQQQLRKEQGLFLYRAMCQDGSDLKAMGSPDHMSGLSLIQEIFMAVDKGSTYRSPFLHFSKDYVQARHWYSRGKLSRREQNGYLCRVSIADLEKFAASQVSASQISASSQDVEARPGTIIDLSTPRTAQQFFGRYHNCEFVTDNLQMLGIAHAHKEVLVCFRGRIPAALFEVINTDTGLGRGFVPELGQALLL